MISEEAKIRNRPCRNLADRGTCSELFEDCRWGARKSHDIERPTHWPDGDSRGWLGHSCNRARRKSRKASPRSAFSQPWRRTPRCHRRLAVGRRRSRFGNIDIGCHMQSITTGPRLSRLRGTGHHPFQQRQPRNCLALRNDCGCANGIRGHRDGRESPQEQRCQESNLTIRSGSCHFTPRVVAEHRPTVARRKAATPREHSRPIASCSFKSPLSHGRPRRQYPNS